MRRRLLLILLAMLIALPSFADIPVLDPGVRKKPEVRFKPEVRLDPRVTKESLEAQLKPLSGAKKVQRVQLLLQNLYPQLRYAESRTDPRSSKDSEKYQSDVKKLRASEVLLKEWLKQRGIKPEPELRPARRGSHQPETLPIAGSTHLIALAFLAGGALLGLRRFLA